VTSRPSNGVMFGRAGRFRRLAREDFLDRFMEPALAMDDPHYPIEHMRIRVTSGVAPDRLNGILDNDPAAARDSECGDNLFRVEDIEALERGTR
jgi:hypothetical protein